jgi:hypothetical protein
VALVLLPHIAKHSLLQACPRQRGLKKAKAALCSHKSTTPHAASPIAATTNVGIGPPCTCARSKAHSVPCYASCRLRRHLRRNP